MTPRLPLALALLAGALTTMSAQPYRAVQTLQERVETVQLVDELHDVTVNISTVTGNIAFEMKVHGKNALWWPYESVADFAASPRLSGVPFLWPWANRLDHDGFRFEGKTYPLNDALGNIGRDGNQLPIHGLVRFSERWKIVSLQADDQGAELVSRLDYSDFADWSAQFPFAHAVEMTYRLSRGELEVRTRIENLGRQTMPVSLGYHPYFQLHAAPRDEWKVSLAARSRWVLSERLIPTGEKQPVRDREVTLQGMALDDVFGDLERGPDGRARFAVSGDGEMIEVLYGEGFDTAVVYAPEGAGREFICFEPMVGPTNAYNLADQGIFNNLQTIAPGRDWSASFYIRVRGF